MSYVEGPFYVEKILKKGFSKENNRNEYLIKWLGYDACDNTWEPAENLPQPMVTHFEEKRAAKKAKKRIASDDVEFINSQMALLTSGN